MQVSIADVAFQTETTTPTPEPLTFDEPVSSLPIVDDARWSASLTDSSAGALLAWIILLVVLQAAAWPIVQRLFPRFPDRGWAFSRLTSITLGGFIVWFPSALGWTEFRAVWCWISLLLVAGGAWYVHLRRRRDTTEAGEPARLAIVGAEAVFWVAFLCFLALRFINPDSYEPVWGGEKPMEFAHINAILRSAHFPPVDPWYAGGYLNYYYYGSYVVAYLIKLTGVPSELAFNLALPMILGLLAAAMYSIGAAIARSIAGSLRVAIGVGVLAAIFSVAIGNLVAAARTWERVTGTNFQDLWSTWVWGPTRIFPGFIITEFPYFAGLYGDLHAHTIALPFTAFIAAIAFSLYQQRDTLAAADSNQLVVRNLAPFVLMSGLLLGTLFMTNAWDTPAYAVLTVLGLVGGTVAIELRPRIAFVTAATVAVAIVAAIVIYPFYQHYVALFSEIDTVADKTPLLPVEAHWGGFMLIMTAGFAVSAFRERREGQWLFDPMIVLPLLGATLVLRWYAVDRTDALADIADYATVIVVAAIWLGLCWVGTDGPGDFGVPPVALRGLIATAGIGAAGGLLTERPVFSLYLAVGAAAGVAWLATVERPERFLWALIAVGMLLGAALEIVFLVDDLASTDAYRMNTVFKFYNQLWTLFAIASAGSVALMLKVLVAVPDEPEIEAAPERGERSRGGWASAGLVITIGVVVLGLAYPVQATGVRLDTRFPHPDANRTLDAYAWMEYGTITYASGEVVSYADDLAAIDWFNEEVEGTPVIAEASFGPYRCNGSRFSIATGLPAVIGWQRHEQQQRDRTLLPRRERDLRELYETPDTERKLEIIEAYDIEFIVVGQTERLYPTIERNGCVSQDMSAGIGAIEGMVGTHLEVAFQQGTTTVYRVVP